MERRSVDVFEPSLRRSDVTRSQGSGFQVIPMLGEPSVHQTQDKWMAFQSQPTNSACDGHEDSVREGENDQEAKRIAERTAEWGLMVKTDVVKVAFMPSLLAPEKETGLGTHPRELLNQHGHPGNLCLGLNIRGCLRTSRMLWLLYNRHLLSLTQQSRIARLCMPAVDSSQ